MTCSHDPCIELCDVCVVRRHREILRDVSLTVRCGEFLVVLGPNGAGKSTLLNVLNGMVKPCRGEVCVLGEQFTLTGAYRVRRSIGYVPQIDAVDSRIPLTTREAVAMGLFGRKGILRRLTMDDWKKVDAALEWVGIRHLAEQSLGSLSGGEFQRVAIARVLVQTPSIFLFDEPTASADPGAQRELLKLIERVHNETKAATVYVTHLVDLLPERCDRVILLRAGRIWFEGTPETALNSELLQALYTG